MQAASATNENISPKAMKAIMLEIRDLTKTPIDGVRVVLNEECVTDVQAEIDGPGASGCPRRSPSRQPLVIGPDAVCCPLPACCLPLAACHSLLPASPADARIVGPSCLYMCGQAS